MQSVCKVSMMYCKSTQQDSKTLGNVQKFNRLFSELEFHELNRHISRINLKPIDNKYIAKIAHYIM